MKKIVLIPDSFKGTLTSMQVCAILKEKILEHFPQCEVIAIPVADGGEGTVDCFLSALGGTRVPVVTKDPFFDAVESFYAVLPDQKTAVIEVAASIGLPLVENRKNPLLASSYGVGELIRHAVENGCKNILIGLGGSSTNDAGAGMASALGVKFFSHGKSFVPTGGTLNQIEEIDLTDAKILLSDCSITAMCDVENPLYGKNGASFIFGPQKGATPEVVEELDRNLKHIADFLNDNLGIDISSLKGGGAAGGLGAGISAFLEGNLLSGIDAVLDTVHFDELITDADLIITGEGRIDSQSMQGKVICGVTKRAAAKKVPVIVIAGDAGEGAERAYELGVSSILSINRRPEPFESSRFKSAENLAFTADSLMRIFKMNLK